MPTVVQVITVHNFMNKVANSALIIKPHSTSYYISKLKVESYLENSFLFQFSLSPDICDGES